MIEKNTTLEAANPKGHDFMADSIEIETDSAVKGRVLISIAKSGSHFLNNDDYAGVYLTSRDARAAAIALLTYAEEAGD